MHEFLTVGHSSHSTDRFLELLLLHGVSSIADVRSVPMSRFAPQFNQEAIRASLKEHKVRYAFLGRELGARSDDPTCYEEGKVQYGRLEATDLFRQGIARLESVEEHEVVAIMCTEKDPLCCHRTLLISRVLYERGHDIKHILGDCSLEDQDDAIERLIRETKVPQPSLLEPQFDPRSAALALREAEIAYVRPASASRVVAAG